MPSYLQAVWRELTLRRVILIELVALAAVVYRVGGTALDGRQVPTISFAVSAVIICFFQFNLGGLAAVAAFEAVRRVGWAALIFPAALLSATILTAVLQWGVRSAFQLRVMSDDWDPSAPYRRYGHMMIIAAETLGFISMIMLAYVNRKREAECVGLAREAELQRYRLENELAVANLAAVRTQIDPAQVVAQLDHLRSLYAEHSSDAEPELDHLVRELRARTQTARVV